MSIKRILIAAAGFASVALPGAASAQGYGYYGSGNGYYGASGHYDRYYGDRYDNRDRHWRERDERRRWREIERRRRWEWRHRHHYNQSYYGNYDRY